MFSVSRISQTTPAPPAPVLPMAPPLLEQFSPMVSTDEPQPGPSGLQRPLVLVRTYWNICIIHLGRVQSFCIYVSSVLYCLVCSVLVFSGMLSSTSSFLRRPGRMRDVWRSLLRWRLPNEGSHLPLHPTSRLTNGPDWMILHRWLALWIRLGNAIYTCHTLSFFRHILLFILSP